jgi:hypothetical protein
VTEPQPQRRSLAERVPFAIYPIAVVMLVGLHLWVASGVSPFAAIRGLLIATAIGVAASAAGTAILRDRHCGGLLGLLIVLAIVAGGRAGVALVLLVPAVFLVVERYGPRHLALNWAWIGRLIARGTAIFALAVVLEAIQLGRFGDLVTAFQREGPFRTTSSVQPPPDAPDVYVLLLDGYARGDILQQRFATDDSAFLDALRRRGFVVSTNSHSNYLVTNLSLNSFLNYRQLSDVPAIEPLLANPASPEGPPVYRGASNPAILADFKGLGYETVAISSGFEQVAVRAADRFIDSGDINEFEIQLLRPSLVAPIATFVSPDVFSAQQRNRIDSVFRTVEQIATTATERPRFVFAHVPSPHAPWVSNRDGSPRIGINFETIYADTPATTGLTREQIIDGYVGQSAYLAGRTVALIDRILLASPRPPIILVLSDHGSSLDVTVANAETRLRNLFAAYTPGHDALFPDDVTLVNVFPRLLDAYFGLDLPLAPETLYTQGPRGLFDPVAISP